MIFVELENISDRFSLEEGREILFGRGTSVSEGGFIESSDDCESGAGSNSVIRSTAGLSNPVRIIIVQKGGSGKCVEHSSILGISEENKVKLLSSSLRFDISAGDILVGLSSHLINP